MDKLEKHNIHPSEFVELNGELCEIDKELIPLIKAMNDLGIKTHQSCQGSSKENAWVEFFLPEGSILRDKRTTWKERPSVVIEWNRTKKPNCGICDEKT